MASRDNPTPELCLQIDLRPEQLSCEATDALTACLAEAALALGVDLWPTQAPSDPWMKRAAEKVEAGGLPLPSGFNAGLQVRNLAALIREYRLSITVQSEEIPGHVERSIQWFETHSGLRVERVESRTEAALHRKAETGGTVRREIMTGCHLSIQSLAGRPHPASAGEQKLHARMEADAGLAGAFLCNQPVTSKHGREYWVDFLNPEWRVVIEVDGYWHHSSKQQFFSDRHRDYELLVSGYLTLRLDHDEVLRDIESAIGKIQDVVELRKSSLK